MKMQNQKLLRDKVPDFARKVVGMKHKLNERLFRSEMVLHGDNNKTLSQYLGIHPISLAKKIHENDGRCFDRKEMMQIKERYGLADDKFIDIFFATAVPENEPLQQNIDSI